MGMAIGAGHAGAGVGLALLARGLLSLVNRWETSKLAGARAIVIRLLIDPAEGKTEVKLEELFDQFHVSMNEVQRQPAADDRELWIVRCQLPRWTYHELLMALVEEPHVCSIQR
jgi:hypothetical protein